MKPLYLKEFVIFFCLFSAASFTANAQSSTAYFDLDACNAIIASGDNMDYSEFTAQINNNSCVELGIVGGYLYRNNPTANKHSCTPGVNGEPAMCISSYPGCDFSPGLDEALRIDVLVTPDVGGTGSLNELTFYEQAPPAYNWINGASGPNNYPTLFSVRVLKNGTEVYLSIDIATSSSWNLNTFSFSGLPEFTVSEPTVFNIELLPYCPVGNGEPVSAWDIDEIYISASCCDAPSGGEITGGPFEFCVGDGIPDHVSGIVLTGQTGPNSQWVITDDQNNILSLPSTPESVNFDGGGPGICLIWHISYEDGLVGLVAGNNLLTDLQGCFGISNSISVIRNQPEGGLLSGGPFEFCVGDSIPDYATGIVLSGNVGTSSLWVVTDAMNTILNLPVSIDSVDFDGAGPGICLIWNISFFDTLSGLIVGNNLLNDVSGCHDLSNSISVIRNHPEGGELSGGPFEFCVGDSIPDHVFGIVLTGNIGDSTQYIITDEANNILNLPDTLEQVDFDGGGQGVCLIWHISYFYAISGLEVGGNLGELAGCFALSNPVSVIRTEPDGGELTGGPFEFCVGDSIPDHVSGIILSGTAGNTQWVITNDSNIILSLPDSIEAVNFDGGGPGICLIWNVSYVDTLSGLVPGNDLFTDVTGCFNVSNSISVVRNQPEGGELIGGPFEFCVGDNIPDYVSGIELVGNVGDSSVWVVTDDMNVILSIPQSIDSVNFDGGGPGICLIWNVSFFHTISGLVAGNNLLSDLSGCFDLSNSISVIRTQPDGGELTGGPFEFCVGDSIPDHVSGIVLTGTSGNTQWVITNDSNIILSLPDSIEAVNFDGGGPGICLIWNVGYVDTLSGLVPGNDLFTDVTGCFNVSNSISVVRNQPEGGELIGGPFEFCVGDSIPDYVSGIELVGNVGDSSVWVVTDDMNVILSIPQSIDSVNFDGGGPGICLIWNVSFFDTISGLVAGNNLLSDLSGCFDLSNSISVIRTQPDGGELTGGPFEFCVGDSIPDHVSGIVLTGTSGNTQWVITNDSNIILSLPDSIEAVDFDGGGPGICLIWNVGYVDTLSGLVPGNDLFTDVTGCFNVSNSISVVRNQPEGGELIGGPFEFCVGDSIPDTVSGIELVGNAGTTSQWVVTNDSNIILSFPDSLEQLDFDGGGPGICLIWNISYFDTIAGFEIGNDLLNDLSGCFGLSNPVTVIRNDPEGGTLAGGPFEFCVGDSIPDHVSGIVLTGNVGDSSQYVITDEFNVILNLPEAPEDVDFDQAPPGTCLIWHVSYYDTLAGLMPGNNLLTDLSGCFSLSNSIAVVRLDCSGLQGDDVLKMQVFPNPVRDKVTLRMSHPGKEDLRVQIIDASGRLCLIENYNTASDIIIDMSRFADGIYFLKAQGDGKYKTERLLLVR